MESIEHQDDSIQRLDAAFDMIEEFGTVQESDCLYDYAYLLQREMDGGGISREEYVLEIEAKVKRLLGTKEERLEDTQAERIWHQMSFKDLS